MGVAWWYSTDESLGSGTVFALALCANMAQVGASLMSHEAGPKLRFAGAALTAVTLLCHCGGPTAADAPAGGGGADSGPNDGDAAAVGLDSGCLPEPFAAITDCTCNAWADLMGACWQPIASGWRLYRDAECFATTEEGTPAAYRSDEPSNVDFSTSHLLEWCMVAGGCAAGPSLEVTERCDSTLTIRFRYEACAGCGTQRLNCVRAIVPREVTEVVAEGIPTACVGAPY